ncbi:MAG: zinc ribbon domain-containing protein [Candidatus Limnocylindria bacterium]
MTAQNSPCPQCGTTRQPDMRFCANCGFDYWKAAEGSTSATQAAPTTAATASVVENSSAAAEEKRNRRFGCVAIGAIALVVIGIIGALNQDEDGVGSPSRSPTPTQSPEPTTAPQASSSASVAPAPAEPTAIPSPIVTVEPEPAFANITLNGNGNSVPRFDIPEDSAAIAEIGHNGPGNVAVWTVDPSGAQTDLLVNTIGNYTGVVLFDESAGAHTDAFDIESGGAWTIVIKPVTEAFSWNGKETLAGSGDDVAILDPASSGLKSTTLTHGGDSNFAIWGYSSSNTDLLVNEIGNYSGEVLLADGTFLFEITANGPWTMSPPQ